MPERGIIHPLPLLVVALLIIGAAVFYFFSQGKLSLPFLGGGPKVNLQESYKNPFKKETQFVNPFDSYKNPFTVNK